MCKKMLETKDIYSLLELLFSPKVIYMANSVMNFKNPLSISINED